MTADSVANSRVSAEFEVEVEANIAPTITLTPSSDQTLPVNSTAHIVVSVADDNFNLNDVVYTGGDIIVKPNDCFGGNTQRKPTI